MAGEGQRSEYEAGMKVVYDGPSQRVIVNFRGRVIVVPGSYGDEHAGRLAGEAGQGAEDRPVSTVALLQALAHRLQHVGGLAEQRLLLGGRKIARRRLAASALPVEDHLARTRSENAIVAKRVEAQRRQRHLNALAVSWRELQGRLGRLRKFLGRRLGIGGANLGGPAWPPAIIASRITCTIIARVGDCTIR